MRWEDDDMASMLEEMGELATCVAGSLYLDFRAPGQAVDNIAGFVTSAPTALAADTDIADLGIEGGENGSRLSIADVDYTVLSIVPRGDGFSTITLGLA